MSASRALTHSQKVVRMYRKAFHSVRDFSEDYDAFLRDCGKIREIVKSRKNETNPYIIQQYVQEFEKYLKYWEHPDPYIPCDGVNGTKWQRNTPPAGWVVNPHRHRLDVD